jgi:hypothetical protein
VASHPGENARLPIDPSLLERDEFLGAETISYTSVSHLTSVDVESFGRAAQATWLLDQVIRAFDIPDINNQLFQLQGLDTAIQSFLVALMQQSSVGRDKYCEAIAITIRSVNISAGPCSSMLFKCTKRWTERCLHFTGAYLNQKRASSKSINLSSIVASLTLLSTPLLTLSSTLLRLIEHAPLRAQLRVFHI